MSNENKANKRIRVTDVITNEDIKSWKPDDVITISAGTGVGKSHFIKNPLYEYAKANNEKILMLVHRSNCYVQFQNEITRDKKQDNIHVATYQKIEHSDVYKKQNTIDLSDYKYVVCDEFHYFIDDAGFNRTTDLSLKIILETKHIVKIFMSATGDDMKRYINNMRNIETIDYEVPYDYSFIKSLTFFHKEQTIEEIFIKEAAKSSDKAMIFIGSAEKAYSLYCKCKKDAIFNCSKSNKHYRYVDSEKIENILKNERFEEKILISTACLDAGVNIIDRDLKHIVVDISDVGSLIQCIGRKRIQDENDKIHVYIKVISNRQLGGLMSYTRKQIEMAEYLRSHTTSEFLEKYFKQADTSNIIFDRCIDGDKVEKCINELMWLKKKLNIIEYKKMIDSGKFGYCDYISRKLNRVNPATDKPDYRLIFEDHSILTFLENQIGKEMFNVKDRKPLIDKLNVRSNGKQLKSINSLNAMLEENGYEYRVLEYKTTKIIKGKKRVFKNAWRVEKYIFDGM